MRFIVPCLTGFVLGALLAGGAVAARPEKDLHTLVARPLRIHPLVFHKINSWWSDTVSPVVTEINLDAMEKNRNEFDFDSVRSGKLDGDWVSHTEPNGPAGPTRMSYRMLGREGDRHRVLYAENAGGSLTFLSHIEFVIESRKIRIEGKTSTTPVLKVVSWASVTEEDRAGLLKVGMSWETARLRLELCGATEVVWERITMNLDLSEKGYRAHSYKLADGRVMDVICRPEPDGGFSVYSLSVSEPLTPEREWNGKDDPKMYQFFDSFKLVEQYALRKAPEPEK